MGFIIGLLTVILVLDCLLLMLLILVQLPKKEAGMGTAFGGATTDALFGSGTGNALTKLTKYATVVFFVLALGLSIINANRAKQTGRLKAAMQTQTTPSPLLPPVTPVTSNTAAAATSQLGSNMLSVTSTSTVPAAPGLASNLLNIISSAATNLPEKTASNTPGVPVTK